MTALKNILKGKIKIVAIVICGALAVFVAAQALGFVLRGRPNVILITAHSLRPSHLSCYGYGHVKTAAIDKLAGDGTLFENAYCSTPHSLYSYATILTGKIGGNVVIRKGQSISLDRSYKLLSQRLKENNYTTLAVFSSQILPIAPDFAHGFDRYDNALAGVKREDYPKAGELVTKKALEALKGAKKNKKPVFAWIEYSLPQFPYITPKGFTKDEGDFPYDRQVLLLDQEIAKLLKGIDKLGLGKNTVIIFTAASGESFDEHKEPTHSIFVYDATAKVPLLIKAPGIKKGKRVNTIVSHVDITPSVLDILKINYSARDFDGAGIISYLKKEDPHRSAYLESMVGYYDFGWSPVVGIVRDGFKYIQLPKPELYDLDNDPHELKNIVYDDAKTASILKRALTKHIDEKRPRLAKLLDKGADPKDKIQYAKPVLLGASFKVPNIETAINFYRDLLAKDPDNKRYKIVLASIYVSQKKFDLAKDYLVSLTRQDPDSNTAWELLGIVYQQQGDNDKAIESYTKALSIVPQMPVSLNNLAWLYAQKGTNLTQALQFAEQANTIVGGSSMTLDTLAEVNLKMGNKTKALEFLKKALAAEPGSEYLKKRIQEIGQ